MLSVSARIKLTDAEREMLNGMSRSTGKSQNELVQEAVRQFLARADSDWRAALRGAFGMWKDRTDLPDFKAMRAECDRIAPPE